MIKPILLAGLALLALAFSPPRESAVPDLICREQRALGIDPRTLEVSSAGAHTTFRIADGSLFISEPDRAEYRYNTIGEPISPGVVTSSNFTIISRDESYEGTVTFVHSDAQRILVSRASCSRQAK